MFNDTPQDKALKFQCAMGKWLNHRVRIRKHLPGTEFRLSYQTFDDTGSVCIEKWMVAAPGRIPRPVIVEYIATDIMQVYLPATEANSLEKELDALETFLINR